MGQIAATVQRPHSSVSRSLKHLEAVGYIVRENGIVMITTAGMRVVREDLRPVEETISSIAAAYQGLRSIGQQYQASFSIARDLAVQYRRNFNLIAEAAQQYQTHIRDTIQRVAEVSQVFQNTYTAVNDMARLTSAVSQNLADFRQAVQVAMQQLDETFRALRPLFERLSKLPAANRAVQEKLLPRGWLISPMLPIGDFLWIHDVLEADGLEVAESKLVDRLDGRCEELVGETYEYESFRRRKRLLDQALGAHRRGEFGLAIPVFLSAIEGVVIDSFGDDKLLASRKRWTRRVPAGKMMEILCEAFWTTMADRLWKSYGLKDVPPPGVLSRHLILHGRSIDYDTKRNSVQAVLTLSYLAFVVGEYIKRTPAA